jgi:hypothetical protein
MSNGYAVMHIAKLKNVSSVCGSSNHTSRNHQPENADSERTEDNTRIIGHDDDSLLDLVKDRIGNNNGKKIRESEHPEQRAVITLELMLTASAEYFRPDCPGMYGNWEVDRLDAWSQINTEWLNDYFGENVVLAELHLDEGTPHIHAYIVPMDDKGHLNAQAFIGDKSKLSKLQTDYALAMQPIGLIRGVKGSVATSESIQSYYNSVNKTASSDLTREDLISHSEDRYRQIEQRNAAIKTSHRLSTKIEALEAIIEAQERVITSHQNGNNPVKDVITLAKVAFDLDLEQNPLSPTRWANDDHDIKITGETFYDFKTANTGNNAIDLIQHVNGSSFTQAVDFLDANNWIGAGQAIALLSIQNEFTGRTEPTIDLDDYPATEKNLKAFLKASDVLIKKPKVTQAELD